MPVLQANIHVGEETQIVAHALLIIIVQGLHNLLCVLLELAFLGNTRKVVRRRGLGLCAPTAEPAIRLMNTYTNRAVCQLTLCVEAVHRVHRILHTILEGATEELILNVLVAALAQVHNISTLVAH